MTVDKDHREIDGIMRQLQKLIWSLKDYPGELKITIEVEDDEV